MDKNLEKKVPPKYKCEGCDYITSRKSQLDRHNTTRKHLRITNLLKKVPNKNNEYMCSCGKSYKYQSGLCKHKKKCKFTENYIVEEEKIEEKGSDLKDMFMKMTEENKELRKLVMKQQEQIGEIIPKIGDKTTINNNKFNLHVFLNEQCKDAINFTDFVNSLTIELDDLALTKDKGLIEGISTVFVNGLKQLDMYKRPIHCTDMKRDILYIKDKDSWEKDDKTKIKKSISDVANKKRKAIQEWTEVNPNWVEDEKLQQEYVKLVNRVMAPIEDDGNGENKIIKNIAKEVTIEKPITKKIDYNINQV